MRTPHLRRGLAAWIACLGLVATPLSAAEKPGPFLYTDAGGSTHMVQTFDEIPSQYRPSVRSLGAASPSKPSKAVEYQARTTAMTKKRLERARAGAKALEAIPERRREGVLFYTASWCGICKYVRAHLEKRGIAYDERSIDDPAHRRELAAKIGGAWVPVVEYEDQRILGYRPEAIDALDL